MENLELIVDTSSLFAAMFGIYLAFWYGSTWLISRRFFRRTIEVSDADILESRTA